MGVSYESVLSCMSQIIEGCSDGLPMYSLYFQFDTPPVTDATFALRILNTETQDAVILSFKTWDVHPYPVTFIQLEGYRNHTKYSMPCYVGTDEGIKLTITTAVKFLDDGSISSVPGARKFNFTFTLISYILDAMEEVKSLGGYTDMLVTFDYQANAYDKRRDPDTSCPPTSPLWGPTHKLRLYIELSNDTMTRGVVFELFGSASFKDPVPLFFTHPSELMRSPNGRFVVAGDFLNAEIPGIILGGGFYK